METSKEDAKARFGCSVIGWMEEKISVNEI
jgi:hypothetical protein